VCYHGGCLQADLGRPNEALRSWQEALQLYERLPTTGLTANTFHENEARTWRRVGDLHRDRQDRAAARQAWEKARAVWDGVLRDEPNHPRLRRERDDLASRLAARTDGG
jgi:hypothetical protein